MRGHLIEQNKKTILQTDGLNGTHEVINKPKKDDGRLQRMASWEIAKFPLLLLGGSFIDLAKADLGKTK